MFKLFLQEAHAISKQAICILLECFLYVNRNSIKEVFFSFSGLQMTDVELDERITALEENDGGGNSVNGETIEPYNSVCRTIL